MFATVGVYGMRPSSFDLLLIFGIGLLGVVMRRFDFPTGSVIVGMILGPMAEAQFRNAMSIGEGRLTVFIERPLSAAALALCIAVVAQPLRMRRRRARSSGEEMAATA